MIQLGSVGSLDFKDGKIVVDIGYQDPNQVGGAKLEADLDVAVLLQHLSDSVSNSWEKAAIDAALAVIKGLAPQP